MRTRNSERTESNETRATSFDSGTRNPVIRTRRQSEVSENSEVQRGRGRGALGRGRGVRGTSTSRGGGGRGRGRGRGRVDGENIDTGDEIEGIVTEDSILMSLVSCDCDNAQIVRMALSNPNTFVPIYQIIGYSQETVSFKKIFQIKINF